MGVHRVELKSDKIPLDLYYLEVFASNGHSQVNSWTFVMVLLALNTPNESESNEHRLGIVHGCTQSCGEKWQNMSRSQLSRDFASNGHSQVNSWTFVIVFLALDSPNKNYQMSTCLGVSMGVHRVLWIQWAPSWHRVVLKSDKIHLDLYYLEVSASNGNSQVNSWTFAWFFLHWILLMIINPMSTCIGSCTGVCTELCWKVKKYI